MVVLLNRVVSDGKTINRDYEYCLENTAGVVKYPSREFPNIFMTLVM